jgi:hypothetical protein
MNHFTSLADLVSNAQFSESAKTLRSAVERMYWSGLLAEQLDAMDNSFFHDVVGRVSRETPTHYKWFLYGTGPADVNIWLHQFKETTSGNSSYARSLHNHRYGFVSLMLSGGYETVGFELTTDNRLADGTSIESVRESSRMLLTPGESYTVSADEFHRIENVREGTATLVVQFPPVRTFSLSFDATTGTLRQHRNLADDRAGFARAYAHIPRRGPKGNAPNQI